MTHDLTFEFRNWSPNSLSFAAQGEKIFRLCPPILEIELLTCGDPISIAPIYTVASALLLPCCGPVGAVRAGLEVCMIAPPRGCVRMNVFLYLVCIHKSLHPSFSFFFSFFTTRVTFTIFPPAWPPSQRIACRRATGWHLSARRRRRRMLGRRVQPRQIAPCLRHTSGDRIR